MLCAGTDLYHKTKAEFYFLVSGGLPISGERATQNETAVFQIQYRTAKLYIQNFT